MTTRKRMVAGAVLVVALGGAGLGVATAATSAGEATVPPRTGGGMHHAGSWSVDYWFAVHMADHHQDAVDMAGLAQQRSPRQQVRDLADQIARTQTEEIALLRTAAQRLRPDGGLQGPRMRVHGGGRGMGGMHGGGHTDLQALSGDAFDRAFLDEMIDHHRMGVHMARMELRGGTDPQVRDLAATMIDVQTREITVMQGWLHTWFGA